MGVSAIRTYMAALVAAIFVSTLARGETIYVITESDCRQLTRHVPAPDVSYQPGVDVRGQPVAPADIGGQTPIQVPEKFTIDIDVFLIDRLGIPVDRSLFSPEANVATITVDGDRVYFEGQPLGNLRQQAISEACRKKLIPEQALQSEIEGKVP